MKRNNTRFLFILIIALLTLGLILISEKESKNSVQTSNSTQFVTLTKEGTITNISSGMKTYSHRRCDDFRGDTPFSITIPSDWEITEEIDEEKASVANYTFKSKDSTLYIACGDGFGGGGCEEGGGKNEYIKTAYGDISACIKTLANGKINISLMTTSTPTATFSFIAEGNKNQILSSLSTFQLN